MAGSAGVHGGMASWPGIRLLITAQVKLLARRWTKIDEQALGSWKPDRNWIPSCLARTPSVLPYLHSKISFQVDWMFWTTVRVGGTARVQPRVTGEDRQFLRARFSTEPTHAASRAVPGWMGA
jgi:hypothetical protein